MNLINKYTLQNNVGIKYFTLDLFDVPGITHGFSTRCENYENDFSLGNESEKRDRYRNLFCQSVGVDYLGLVTLKQIHSDKIVVFDQTADVPPMADAAITRQPGLALAVQTADCVPVLVADPKNQVIAAVHAGWRGTAANILGKTLQRMFELGAEPQNCMVGIGACIGQCCYQVDEAVINQFKSADIPWEQFVVADGDTNWRLNLAAVNCYQAQQMGVPAAQISQLDLCTACSAEHFFSYRRENKTGRMMNVIALSGI